MEIYVYVHAYKIEILHAVSNKIWRRSKDVWRTTKVKILPVVEQGVEQHDCRATWRSEARSTLHTNNVFLFSLMTNFATLKTRRRTLRTTKAAWGVRFRLCTSGSHDAHQKVCMHQATALAKPFFRHHLNVEHWKTRHNTRSLLVDRWLSLHRRQYDWWQNDWVFLCGRRREGQMGCWDSRSSSY